MAQIFMRTIQTSSFVDMLTCSDEVQPSTALFYTASQQPRQTEVNIHPTDIPLHSTLASPPSKILILFNKIQEQSVDQAKFSPCIGRKNFRNK